MSCLCSKTFSCFPFPTVTQPFVAEGESLQAGSWKSMGYNGNRVGLQSWLCLKLTQTWDSFLSLCFLLSNGVKRWGFGVMNFKHSAPIFYFAIILFSEPYPSADSGVFELWYIAWCATDFKRNLSKTF